MPRSPFILLSTRGQIQLITFHPFDIVVDQNESEDKQNVHHFGIFKFKAFPGFKFFKQKISGFKTNASINGR